VEFGADELLRRRRRFAALSVSLGLLLLLHAQLLIDMNGEYCVAPAADVVHARVTRAAAQRTLLQAVHLRPSSLKTKSRC
jgi:hypothetical protein